MKEKYAVRMELRIGEVVRLSVIRRNQTGRF